MKTGIAAVLAALILTGCVGYWRQDMSDPAIKARVVHELKANPRLDLSRVDIDVHAGTVTLSGIVGSEEDRDEIRRIVRRIRGVDQLDMNVLVQY